MLFISKLYYKEILKLIKQRISNKDYEFEIRLCGLKHKKKFTNIILNQLSFQKLLQYLTYKKSNNGLDLKVKKRTYLDINIDTSDIRITISELDHIKKYWLTNLLSDKINYNIIKKNNINLLDLDNYSLRFSLSNEKKLENKNFNIDINSKIKTFRYKNRYELITEDNLFRIDLTEVRQATGKILKHTNIFNLPISYEIELEYIGNIKNEEMIINSLFDNISKILSIYQGCPNLITNNEYNSVIKYYKILTKSNNFIAANPVTLHVKNLTKKYPINILKNYSVTHKADGERFLIIIFSSIDSKLNGNIYLLNNNFQLINTGVTNTKWIGSILEGEYIKEQNTCLIYDILFQKNKDIRKLPLFGKSSNRQMYLQMFCEDVKEEKDFIFKEKKYFYLNDSIFNNCKELLETNIDIPVDGLIFTPINLEYRTNKRNNIFKWKPPKYNSIDFLIEIQKENGEDLKYPFVYNKKTDTLSNIFQYKVIKLKVSGFREKYNNIKKIREKKCIPVDFSQENICHIPIINNNIYAIDQLLGTKHIIKDDQIVEFIYDISETIKEFRWKPIRVRYDKTYKYKRGENMFGNFETVALDIWNSIMTPVTEYMLSTGDVKDVKIEKDVEYYNNETYNSNPNKRLTYQKFHTQYVKKTLLKETMDLLENKDDIKLMDIGYGKLGDLPSWKANNISFIFGLDNNSNNFELASNIYTETPLPKPEIILTYADYGKLIYPDFSCACDKIATELMTKFLMSKNQFDIVSSQFSLSYFWDNEVILRTVLQNVTDSLKIGGYFIGTCFNGKRVMEKLDNKKEVTGSVGGKVIWSIKKLYRKFQYTPLKPNFNKKIEVFISSFGKKFTENLVNMEYFVTLCNQYKLELVKNESFKTLYNAMEKNKNYNNISKSMTDSEKEFSFLNDIFIFKKVEPAPVILFTKLKKKLSKK